MDYSENDSREFTQWKLDREQALAAHAEHRAEGGRFMESTVSFGLEAIRTAALVNGGAAIAMMAFLGATFSSESASANAVRLSLFVPAFIFAIGAVLSGLASGLAYLAQRFFYDDHALVRYQWHKPFVDDLPEAASARRRGNSALQLCVTCVCLSYGAVLLGMYKAWSALSAAI